MQKAVRQSLVLVVLALLISGCAVRFVYNQLDWLVPWYLEDYIELEGPQEKLFKTRLESYLQWHRHEQLPLYAEFLENVASQAEKGLTRDQIAAIQRRTEELAQAMIDRLQPDMIELFAMASDEQVERLFEKFEKDNKRYREEYLKASPKEQRKQRAKEARNYVERWTGSLRDEQHKMIRRWSDSYELMGKELAETRLAWQKEFRRILELRQDREVYEAAFKQLLANPGFGQSEALKKKLERNQKALVDLYLELDESLSAGQRTHMVKKLRSYANDFRHLAAQ